MCDRQEGLTKTYNRFHDYDETSDEIQKLRQLHVEMDNAVTTAYGWTDLDLGHGFHETKQGVRYTISEPARREVLARLLKLNHERYAEEVKQGAIRRARSDSTNKLDGFPVIKKETLDGVKFFLDAPTPDHGAEPWVLFRASGTEPLLRVYAEAASPELVNDILAQAENFVTGRAE